MRSAATVTYLLLRVGGCHYDTRHVLQLAPDATRHCPQVVHGLLEINVLGQVAAAGAARDKHIQMMLEAGLAPDTAIGD